ncbi:MAG: integrin alpha [Polyangiales bacterium]
MSSPGDGFGTFVAAAGDLDGDGYADFAVGSRNVRSVSGSEDTIHIYRGGPSDFDETPAAVLHGSELFRVGWSAVGAGDLDGDGYGDLAVSRSDAPYGATALHYGGPSGVSTTPSRLLPSAVMAGGYFEHVAAGGDLDGDGRSDLLVGPVRGGSAVSVFLNSPSGLPELPSTRLIAPLRASGGFGFSLVLLTPTSRRCPARRRG